MTAASSRRIAASTSRRWPARGGGADPRLQRGGVRRHRERILGRRRQRGVGAAAGDAEGVGQLHARVVEALPRVEGAGAGAGFAGLRPGELDPGQLAAVDERGRSPSAGRPGASPTARGWRAIPAPRAAPSRPARCAGCWRRAGARRRACRPGLRPWRPARRPRSRRRRGRAAAAAGSRSRRGWCRGRSGPCRRTPPCAACP